MADVRYKGSTCALCRARIVFISNLPKARKCSACFHDFTEENVTFIKRCLFDSDEGVLDTEGTLIRAWYPAELKAKRSTYRLNRKFEKELADDADSLLLGTSTETSEQDEEEDQPAEKLPSGTQPESTDLVESVRDDKGKGRSSNAVDARDDLDEGEKSVPTPPSQPLLKSVRPLVSSRQAINRAPVEEAGWREAMAEMREQQENSMRDLLEMMRLMVAESINAATAKARSEPIKMDVIDTPKVPKPIGKPAASKAETVDKSREDELPWRNNLRSIQLASFTGDKGQNAKTFLDSVTTVLSMNGVPEAEWRRIIFARLLGHAMTMAVSDKVAERCTTYHEFKVWMFKVWPPSATELSEAFGTLSKMKWTVGMDFSAFATKFQTCAAQTDISEELKIQLFHNAVPDEPFARDLRLKGCRDLSSTIGYMRSMVDRLGSKEVAPATISAPVATTNASKEPKKAATPSPKNDSNNPPKKAGRKQLKRLCAYCDSEEHSWVGCSVNATGNKAKEAQEQFRKSKK